MSHGEIRKAPEGFEVLPVAHFGSYGDFEDLIGPLYVAEISRTSLRFGFFTAKKHCNYYGIVHGGVFMSVVDSMMGNLVFASLDPGERVATISVTSDFIGVARADEWVDGDAVVLRRGRNVAFTEARMRAAGKLIFVASAKFAISAPPAKE